MIRVVSSSALYWKTRRQILWRLKSSRNPRSRTARASARCCRCPPRVLGFPSRAESSRSRRVPPKDGREDLLVHALLPRWEVLRSCLFLKNFEIKSKNKRLTFYFFKKVVLSRLLDRLIVDGGDGRSCRDGGDGRSCRDGQLGCHLLQVFESLINLSQKSSCLVKFYKLFF